MKEGIRREVCGHIKPFVINTTVAAPVQPVVDWHAIAAYHKPSGSTEYIFKGQLEYLNCDYYIDSLLQIDSDNLPKVKELRDTNLQKQTKYAEFKQDFNAKSRHAIELMIHTKWESQNWGMPKASEYLYNLGQYGYINLFDPYLVRDAEILYSDERYKVGISYDGLLGEGDIIEINGGYSGVISYFEPENQEYLSEKSGSVKVGTTATEILRSRSNRKILFVCNNGTTRLHFQFVSNSSAVSLNSPFIEPGESLSMNFENASWSGGNQHNWVSEASKYYIGLHLYGIRESGNGSVSFQEFY
ncbi:MAG: hypothetical protein AAGF85_20850 [Bacteroidota bacterium]